MNCIGEPDASWATSGTVTAFSPLSSFTRRISASWVPRRVDWHDRSHFYALAARLMRQILVDHARSRGRQKRGGAALAVTLDEAAICPRESLDLGRLDDALHALADTDMRKSRVVELRFFGGFSVDEVAAILDVSPQTVLRDWRLAKAWLQREMRRESRARR